MEKNTTAAEETKQKGVERRVAADGSIILRIKGYENDPQAYQTVKIKLLSLIQKHELKRQQSPLPPMLLQEINPMSVH